MVRAMEDIFSRSLRTFLKPVLAFWDDPDVLELLIHGENDIWVDRGGPLEKADAVFSEDELFKTIRKIAQLMGVLVNEENPHLTKRLSDGTEVSIVLPPLSKSGPVLALRKGQIGQPTLEHLCLTGFLTPAVASLLRAALVSQQSILLVGATGSGVGQLLQALVREIPALNRLIRVGREGALPLEHPHLLSFSLSSEKGSPTSVEELMPTMMMLRPHRVVLEDMHAKDSPALLQWMTGRYPGSLATLRAYHVRHALQILVTHGLQSRSELSAAAVRSSIENAFSLVVGCRRQANGRACLEEVTELLPLHPQGTFQFLPLFRRQILERANEGSKSGSSDVLLPLGHLPSFWPQIRHWKDGILDRAFFHPANYNSDGIRLESKAIPTTAPVGVSMEAEEERERRPSSIVESEAILESEAVAEFHRHLEEPEHALVREREAVGKSIPPRTPAVEQMMARVESSQRSNVSPKEAEEPFEQTVMQGPSKIVQSPKTSMEVASERESQKRPEDDKVVAKKQPKDDKVVGAERSLLDPTDDEKTSAPLAKSAQKTRSESHVSTEKGGHPRASGSKDKQQQPQPMALNPETLGVGPAIPTPILSPLGQQVVLGTKPGLMDSVEFSTALTVSRVTPPKVDGVSTSPQVIVDPELLPPDQVVQEISASQILGVSDMIADESPSVLSEEDLRQVERDLRQPVQQRDSSTQMVEHPNLATEIVSRDMMTPGGLASQRKWSVPEQSYTDPEDTFRQGLSPVLGGVRPTAKTVPDAPSVEDDPALQHISSADLEQARPSVIVRRGSRQQATPSMGNAGDATNIRAQTPSARPSYEQALRASQTGVPMQSPHASYSGIPAQNPHASHTSMSVQSVPPAQRRPSEQGSHSSHTSLPAQPPVPQNPPPVPQNPPPVPQNLPPVPQNPPPLPAGRVSGIRPPGSPPPVVPVNHSPTSNNGNDATLIRGRRPPQIKK